MIHIQIRPRFARHLLPLALLLGAAQAAPVDCRTARFDPNGFLNYQDVEVFPNPVKKTALSLSRPAKPFTSTLCGITVNADGQRWSFKAKTLEALVDAVNLYSLDIVGDVAGLPDAATLRFQFPNGLLTKALQISGFYGGSYFPDDALIAARLDGGPLLPLLYNGQFRSIERAPAKRTLELFIKSSAPVRWEHLTLDIARRQLTFDRTFPFPTR